MPWSVAHEVALGVAATALVGPDQATDSPARASAERHVAALGPVGVDALGGQHLRLLPVEAAVERLAVIFS